MEKSLLISFDDGKTKDSDIQLDRPCLTVVKPLHARGGSHKMKLEVISQFFDEEAERVYEILTRQRRII